MMAGHFVRVAIILYKLCPAVWPVNGLKRMRALERCESRYGSNEGVDGVFESIRLGTVSKPEDAVAARGEDPKLPSHACERLRQRGT